MTISNTPIASTDFSRFLRWLYQTHPSLRLTSAGFSMTISNTPIASTEFGRFFHDYIKHTHRLDWLQQVFPWIYQTHPSPRLTSAGFSKRISNTPIASTDFSRLFHDYIKHIHRFDWLQQVFPWLYQTHPSLRLSSAGFSMTISNTPFASTDFSRFFHEYIKHTHRLDWLQQVFPREYQTHPSLRRTSAGYSMTISNTSIASTDFSRFFYDYIKHTHHFDGLQQVFPWLYQTHTSSWLTSAGFTMTISNTLTASTDFSRFFYDYIKHTDRLDWFQQIFRWQYQTHPSLRLTSAGFSMTILNTPIASTEFSRFFHDYIKHTHRFHWLQQVFPWIYQTHPSLPLTSAGFSMTISNTSIASTDFNRFFHDNIKHTHRFDWVQQVFPWLYQTHPSIWLTSAGFSMTISNTPIASTDFSSFFHDYQTHPSLRLSSASCSMTISNIPIVLTDFSRFFHDYIKHTHRFDWLQQGFLWLYLTHRSPRLISAGFYDDYIKHIHRFD